MMQHQGWTTNSENITKHALNIFKKLVPIEAHWNLEDARILNAQNPRSSILAINSPACEGGAGLVGNLAAAAGWAAFPAGAVAAFFASAFCAAAAAAAISCEGSSPSSAPRRSNGLRVAISAAVAAPGEEAAVESRDT